MVSTSRVTGWALHYPELAVLPVGAGQVLSTTASGRTPPTPLHEYPATNPRQPRQRMEADAHDGASSQREEK
jgi:hypothetical protein